MVDKVIMIVAIGIVGFGWEWAYGHVAEDGNTAMFLLFTVIGAAAALSRRKKNKA